MLNINNNKQEVYILDKQNKDNKDAELNNTEIKNDISPYEGDTNNISIDIKKASNIPNIISFDLEDKKINSLIENLMNSELKPEDIQKFISDINDSTIKAILDSIDKTIENARKMMEENKVHYEKVEKPKLEMIKKILKQDLILKENKFKQ